jgi:signal transduction histidine kinase
LSIVKKIINLHEGDIWLESEPNVGTTFYFTIKKNK